MKTAMTILSATALLALGACAKHDDAGANATTEQATTNFSEFGNDSGFASENVVLPEENATALNTTDSNTAELNSVTPANTN